MAETNFDFDAIATAVLEPDTNTSNSLSHNLASLRATHWGTHNFLKSKLEFDPRADWWYRPERRFVLAFCVHVWPRWPIDPAEHPAIAEFAVALSSLAEEVWEGKQDKTLTVDYDAHGGTRVILADLRSRLASWQAPGWDQMGRQKFRNDSSSNALLKAISRVEKEGFSELERGLRHSMAWWALLGCRSVEAFERRQADFWHYRLSVASSNAYMSAGALFFGPLIGNTSASVFRGVFEKWSKGVKPVDAPLLALGREDLEPSDRSHTNIAREIWGLLNLHRAPFYNAQAERYLQAGEDPIDATLALGKRVRAWLEQHPDRVEKLAAAFDRHLVGAKRFNRVPIAQARRFQERLDKKGNLVTRGSELDVRLFEQLRTAGSAHLIESNTPLDRAAMLMHLGLDAEVRPWTSGGQATDGGSSAAEPGETYAPDGAPLSLRRAKRVWTYAPGQRASQFEPDLRLGIASLHWDEVPDLGEYESKTALRDNLSELLDTDTRQDSAAGMLWSFCHKIEVGDLIVARKGIKGVVGIGKVTAPYSFDPKRSNGHPHAIGVHWFWDGEYKLKADSGFAIKTLTEITRRQRLLRELDAEVVSKIEATALPGDMGGDSGGDAAAPMLETRPFYGIDDALDELFFSEDEVRGWERQLRRRKNIILQGPPGVGKTYVAKRLAYLMMKRKAEDQLEFVQFHQAYTYEQFVRGYRPTADGSFELDDGPLVRIAERAAGAEDDAYVLIIDEINRGNISRILGEALMLLEADKRGGDWKLRLAYSHTDDRLGEEDATDDSELFFLPDNLYVIGTMNTADRSLAVVDYALRRRFAFINLAPRLNSAEYRSHAIAAGLPETVLREMTETVAHLNQMIRDDAILGAGFEIGHSFFTAAGEGPGPWAPESNTAEADEALDEPVKVSESETLEAAQRWLKEVFEFEIAPLVEEYWAEDPARRAEALKLLGLGA